MFIRLTSIFLILIMLSASFTKLIYYAGYQLNKEYISTVLCENKAKPKLNCKGKCYLSKKVKEADDKEQKQGSSLSKSNMEVLITEGFNFRCFIYQTDEYHISSAISYTFFSLYKIFQPPKF